MNEHVETTLVLQKCVDDEKQQRQTRMSLIQLITEQNLRIADLKVQLSMTPETSTNAKTDVCREHGTSGLTQESASEKFDEQSAKRRERRQGMVVRSPLFAGVDELGGVFAFLSLVELAAFNWCSSALVRAAQKAHPALGAERPRRITELLINQTPTSWFRVRFRIVVDGAKARYRRQFELPRPEKKPAWEAPPSSVVKEAQRLECARLASRFPTIPPPRDMLGVGSISFDTYVTVDHCSHEDGRYPLHPLVLGFFSALAPQLREHTLHLAQCYPFDYVQRISFLRALLDAIAGRRRSSGVALRAVIVLVRPWLLWRLSDADVAKCKAYRREDATRECYDCAKMRAYFDARIGLLQHPLVLRTPRLRLCLYLCLEAGGALLTPKLADECEQWLYHRSDTTTAAASERLLQFGETLQAYHRRSAMTIANVLEFVWRLVRGFKGGRHSPANWALVVVARADFDLRRRKDRKRLLNDSMCWNGDHRCRKPVRLPPEFRVENEASGEALTLAHLRKGDVESDPQCTGFVLRRHCAVGPLPRLEFVGTRDRAKLITFMMPH